jgi:cation:H+ antiporter
MNVGMLSTVGELFFSMVVVFFGALLFTNGIEYVGCRMRWTSSFTGAILAPLFTSVPEMVLFLVAVFSYGGVSGREIGIGTLFGQPFMASSFSYGLVLIAMLVGWLLKKRENLSLEVEKTLVIPYTFITLLFPLVLIPDLIQKGYFQYIMGLFFGFFYIYYVKIMFRKRGSEEIEEPEDPYFCKVFSADLAAVIQLALSAAILYVGSEMLISTIDVVAESLTVSALGIAIILAPAATAIPETMSAMIWAYRGKDTLSISSLVGEKILYSTFYPAIGLFTVPWILDLHAYFSVLATTVISLVLLYYIKKGNIPSRGLGIGFIFFITYAILVFYYAI